MAINGNWTLFFDWGCSGSYQKVGLTFNGDGTWTSNQGHRGRWVEIGGMFILNFAGTATIYTGNVSGLAMTGVSTTFSGFNGCWHAIKDGIATTLKKPDDQRDFAG
jgi:hypothetical protein